MNALQDQADASQNFAQASLAAVGATQALLNAGGVGAMALQAALGPVTAALGQLQAGLGQLQAGQAAQQLTLNQLQAGQAAQQLTLNQLLAGQAAQSTLLAKLHNRQCGDGRSVPFLPVPNGAGNLVPQGLQPLHDVDAICALTHNQLAVWLGHFGAALQPSTVHRRLALCMQLGVHVCSPRLP